MNNTITRADVENNTNIRVQVAEGNDVLWSLPTLKKHMDSMWSEVEKIDDLLKKCGEPTIHLSNILNKVQLDLHSAKHHILRQLDEIYSTVDGAKAFIACNSHPDTMVNPCPCRYYASRNYGVSKVAHVVVLRDGSVLKDFDSDDIVDSCASTELATDPNAPEVWVEDIVQPEACDECGTEPEKHDQMYSVTLCDNYVKGYAE